MTDERPSPEPQQLDENAAPTDEATPHEAPPVEEPALLTQALVDDEPPQPVLGPADRASIRRSAGLGLAGRVALGAAGLAAVPAAAGAAVFLALAPPTTTTTTTTAAVPGAGPVPAAVDLGPAEAQVRHLVAEVVARQQAELARAEEDLMGRLNAEIPRLMKEIRVARDARLKAGQRTLLGGPFTAEELGAAFPALELTAGRGRILLDREGKVIAPEGATLPDGVDLAAPGTSAATFSRTLGEGEQRTIVARACVPREKHCLAEVATFALSTPDVTATLEALAAAQAADASLRAQLSERQAAPPPVIDDGSSRSAAAAAALIAAALGALLLFAWVRRSVGRALLDAGERLALALQGTPRPASRVPADAALLHRAIDDVGDRMSAFGRLREERARQRTTVYGWCEQLDEVAAGRLDVRLAPATEDVASEALAESVNRMLEALEQRVARLKSHLAVLSRQGAAGAGEDDDGPRAALHRRIEHLRPVGSLLSDIAVRVKTLSAAAPEGSGLRVELSKLGDAMGARARTAGALIDGLEGEVDSLASAGGGGGLSPEASRALHLLAQDLDRLGQAPSLAVLAGALQDLAPDEARARMVAQA